MSNKISDSDKLRFVVKVLDLVKTGLVVSDAVRQCGYSDKSMYYDYKRYLTARGFLHGDELTINGRALLEDLQGPAGGVVSAAIGSVVKEHMPYVYGGRNRARISLTVSDEVYEYLVTSSRKSGQTISSIAGLLLYEGYRARVDR